MLLASFYCKTCKQNISVFADKHMSVDNMMARNSNSPEGVTCCPICGGREADKRDNKFGPAYLAGKPRFTLLSERQLPSPGLRDNEHRIRACEEQREQAAPSRVDIGSDPPLSAEEREELYRYIR